MGAHLDLSANSFAKDLTMELGSTEYRTGGRRTKGTETGRTGKDGRTFVAVRRDEVPTTFAVVL